MVTQSMNRLCIRQRDFIKKMRQVFIAASFFIPLSIQAQDTLRIDLAQALEIALSEKPDHQGGQSRDREETLRP